MRAYRIHPGSAARAAMASALVAALACAKSAPVTNVGAPKPGPTPAATSVTTATSAGEVSSGATAAMSGAISAAAPLLASLSTAVPGLTESQVALGAGALFGLAQSRMPTGEYTQLTAAVHGAAPLVAAAQDQGLPGAASLTNASVAEFLGRSGITPAQVTQLSSALGGAVGAMVPGSVAASFASALK